MKSIHNFTFFYYFDVLLPNFVLPKLYFALPILNIELSEHNIRLPMIDIVLYKYIIPNISLKRTYYLQMYESYFHHI